MDGKIEAALESHAAGSSRPPPRAPPRPPQRASPFPTMDRGVPHGRTHGTPIVDVDDVDSQEGTSYRTSPHSRHDDDLQSIKFTIPIFKGTSDPNEFLEWKGKMELIFACHDYSDFKKVQMAVVEFREYALTWWEKTRRDWARLGAPPIDTWRALIRAMEARFIPLHYMRDLHLKLQALNQGSKSVEEYYKEMELLMMRSQREEEDEVTMARFVDGLRREIRDVVELQSYHTLEELVQLATKVEGQIKRRGQRDMNA